MDHDSVAYDRDFGRLVRDKTQSNIPVKSAYGPADLEGFDYERDAKKQAEIALQTIADRARAAGVDYDAEFTQSDRPHEAIIRAAEKHGCDLIFMASHGRRGLSALVHGSETQGVLTHSTIPTLVYR